MAVPSMTIQQALELGVQHHQSGRLREAEGIFRQILSIQPNQPDAMHFLGLIAYQTGNVQPAIDMLRRAIAVNPTSAAYHTNLGRMLGETGHADEGMAAYAQAIRLRPDNFEAYHNLGTTSLAQDKLDQAIAAFRNALRVRPDAIETMNNLGQALHKTGQCDEAIALFRKVLQLNPNHTGAHTNLGIALKLAGDIPGAVLELTEAVRIEPNSAEARINFGKVMQAVNDQDAAIESFRLAIQIAPQKYDGYYNLGNALHEKGQDPQAIEAFHQALALNPQAADVYNNLALSYHDVGRFAEEIEAYQKSLALKPDAPLMRYNLGLAQLLLGDYANGWAGYELRTRTKELNATWQDFSQPRWDGADLNGRRILIHAEQAFGDTIQFVRYLSLVAERGGHVLLQCHAELLQLFNGIEGAEQVIPLGQPLPEFDLHCPLLSLPTIFHTEIETIPNRVPYIKANEEAAARWRQRIGSNEQKKVGLVWAGRAKPSPHRSIPLEQLAPLSTVANVAFFSLQIGGASQNRNSSSIIQMIDWTNELTDFAETAALIQNLDLVISIDTAVAHLAGAMGKPVWLLAMFVPDWRWLLERSDSPWYPTMKIFRQKHAGDWTDPVNAIVENLRQI